MITATELLEFLNKAQKLSADPIIIQNDKGYYINLYYDWFDDGERHCRSVFITNEGESNWNTGGDWNFITMNNILDEKLEEKLQKEIKARKRKELIESLTPEQRELLGV